MKKIISRIIIGLSAVGPGLFLIGYNIGTGSVTTMAKAGAEHGMTLFWALVLSCIFTFILMVAYGRVTLVTGKTALNNIKTNFKYGRILAIYILFALIMGELLALMGIMGIIADLIQEGIYIASKISVSTLTIMILLVAILYSLVWKGRYLLFEKFLTIFVIFMGLCFIVVFFMISPDYFSILRGLIPKIPDQDGSFTLVAAMAGTTCSAAVFIMRSTIVKEKGWNINHLKQEKKDAFVSIVMMLFLSGIIMAVAAGTLHVMGLRLTNTVEMIQLFAPIGGDIVTFIFILGIVGAGISTAIPIVLMAPYLICDYTGKPRDLRSPLFRILIFIGFIFGFGLQFLEQRPPEMMIFSQAFQACILPAVAIPVFILGNRKNIMKSNLSDLKMNIGLMSVIMFSLLTTYFAVIDIL